MAKKQKVAPAQAPTQAPVAAPKTKRTSRLRLALADARKHNGQFIPLARKATPVAAGVAGTLPGTNAKKARVYGYDNLANGGGIPKDKMVVLVATTCPRGVAQGQWDALCKAVKSAHTVATLRDGGIAGRTLRRAYRAGALRFSA